MESLCPEKVDQIYQQEHAQTDINIAGFARELKSIGLAISQQKVNPAAPELSAGSREAHQSSDSIMRAADLRTSQLQMPCDAIGSVWPEASCRSSQAFPNGPVDG